MASTNDISARTETDPPWHPKLTTVLGDLPPVEILLVQGRWPEDSDHICNSCELKVALQVVKKPIASRGTGKRKRSRPLAVPSVEGWECGSCVLKYNAIGGVTNQSFLIWWRVRTGCIKPTFSFPLNPSNCTLKRCLFGATLEGMKVDEPSDHKLNTEKGLMVCSQLSEGVVVQTVYHSWVKRKLSTQEQVNVLDFPEDRTVKMTDEELLVLTKKEKPGKILTAASWFLKEWAPANIKDNPSDKTTIPEDSPPPVDSGPKMKISDLSYQPIKISGRKRGRCSEGQQRCNPHSPLE
jgi:hypothetical protein